MPAARWVTADYIVLTTSAAAAAAGAMAHRRNSARNSQTDISARR